MSEKRFICGLGFPINSDDPIRIISDSVEDKDYYKFSDICNVLNEQQATITHLEKVNGKNFAKRRLLEKDNLILRNENEQLRRLFEEMKQPITVNLTEEDEKELRKLLGIDCDE